MSRGPGRIERTVAGIVAADPTAAFTVDELAARAYPGVAIGRRHRVAVRRAGRRLADSGRLGVLRAEGLGRPMLFYARRASAEATPAGRAAVADDRSARAEIDTLLAALTRTRPRRGQSRRHIPLAD